MASIAPQDEPGGGFELQKGYLESGKSKVRLETSDYFDV
jgi:hypothetical protein